MRRSQFWCMVKPSTPPSASCSTSPNGLVARLCLLFGPSRSGKEGYFDRTTAALKSGVPQAFFTDELRTPLHYAIASRILIRLAVSETRGLLHVGGSERLSRYELMRRAAAAWVSISDSSSPISARMCRCPSPVPLTSPSAPHVCSRYFLTSRFHQSKRVFRVFRDATVRPRSSITWLGLPRVL